MTPSYMIENIDTGFKSYYTPNSCAWITSISNRNYTLAHVKEFLKRNGKDKYKVFIENHKSYRFVKDGKTCKGSERWLPIEVNL